MIIYVQYLLYKLHLMTFNYSTTMGDRRTMELLETFSEQYSSIYIVLQYQSKWTIKISIVANALGNYLSSNWNSYLVTVFHIYKILSGWSNDQIWSVFLTCWKSITFLWNTAFKSFIVWIFLFLSPQFSMSSMQYSTHHWRQSKSFSDDDDDAGWYRKNAARWKFQ